MTCRALLASLFLCGLFALDHVIRVAFNLVRARHLNALTEKASGKTLYSDKERFGPYKAIPNPKGSESKKPDNF